MNVTSFVNQFVKPKTHGTEMGYALTALWLREMVVDISWP